jgi:hypothetical protein
MAALFLLPPLRFLDNDFTLLLKSLLLFSRSTSPALNVSSSSSSSPESLRFLFSDFLGSASDLLEINYLTKIVQSKVEFDILRRRRRACLAAPIRTNRRQEECA